MTRVGAHLLGAKFSLAERLSPTRPHPAGPDRRFGLLTKGLAVATTDHMRDAIGGRHPYRAVASSQPLHGHIDAIAVLEDDHRRIEVLLADPDKAKHDAAAMQRLVKLLSIHDAIEREHFYPVVRDRLPNGNEAALRSFDEHPQAAAMLAEIDRRAPSDHDRWALVEELAPVVRHHIAQEESDIFPALRLKMAPAELEELGAVIDAAKAKAATRPHPHLPTLGGGSRFVVGIVAPIDKARDKLRRSKTQL